MCTEVVFPSVTLINLLNDLVLLERLRTLVVAGVYEGKPFESCRICKSNNAEADET